MFEKYSEKYDGCKAIEDLCFKQGKDGHAILSPYHMKYDRSNLLT